MAKKSMVEREKKRQKLVDKYAKKREELQEEFSKATSQQQRLTIHRQIQQLPRNSAPQSPAKPLLGNRSPQRLLSRLWRISSCLERNGAPGIVARCGEVELVIKIMTFEL